MKKTKQIMFPFSPTVNMVNNSKHRETLNGYDPEQKINSEFPKPPL